MAKTKRKLSKPQLVKKVQKLNEEGYSIKEACKKAGLSGSSQYYQWKNSLGGEEAIDVKFTDVSRKQPKTKKTTSKKSNGGRVCIIICDASEVANILKGFGHE